MTTFRIANVIHANEPLIVIEHAGELLSVKALEQRFAVEWSPSQFTDCSFLFRHRVFSLGMAGLEELAEILDDRDLDSDSVRDATVPKEAVIDKSKCLFLPPTVESPALAEFFVLAEDEVPRFRWGNARCLRGHDAPLPIPVDEPAPQLSVQVAAVVMEELHHATVNEAARRIAGITPLCLWSFPSRHRVSPGWGSFSLGQIGPCLVCDFSSGSPSGNNLDPTRWCVTVRVNGRTVVRAPGRTWQTSFAEMVALASEAAALAPGDIIASGPLAGTSSDGVRDLCPGDRIEVTIQDLGTLSGTLVSCEHPSRFLHCSQFPTD